MCLFLFVLSEILTCCGLLKGMNFCGVISYDANWLWIGYRGGGKGVVSDMAPEERT